MTDGMRILLVDDEQSQRTILGGYLRKKGHIVCEASSATEAIKRVGAEPVDVVLSDLKMPGKSGLDLLKEVKGLAPETTVVIMTAFGTIEGAVHAMKEGAYDFLSKPIDLEQLDLLLARVKERRALLSENRILKEQLSERYSFVGVVSQSGAMQEVLNTAARVADSRASILIRGESGTGKELIARAIHFASPRKEKAFIAVNCAALNENLLESELFGHERGAFTGADRLKQGRFELADGGTLFLDEVGDLPLATQVKLLRVLQEQQFERVGGTETHRVDVRILAATNKNLEEMIRAGSFREDLFYRLNVVTIDIPPLRSRREDIAPLLEHFLALYSREQKRSQLAFSREGWSLLLRYDYPGNVRELDNIVHRAVILSRGEIIASTGLPLVVRGLASEDVSAKGGERETLPKRVEKLEQELVFEALRKAGGNQSRAAKDLGISERNLRYRLSKWKVK
jgi:DNA-binding NtrC family response regulator